MNGQGPTSNNPGFPDRQRQQKPKFNFNSKDVKKEITSDFMAAQLASFGSSAKLKSMPNQQQPDASKQQQMGSGFGQGFGSGVPQMNQGFRQQMMPQMAFQGQSYMQPQMPYHMQSMPGVQNMSQGMQNMAMGMQGQFSSGSSNASFGLSTTQATPFGMSTQAQQASFGIAAQAQPNSFGMPTQAQQASFGIAAQAQPNSFGMPTQAQQASFSMASQTQPNSFGMSSTSQNMNFSSSPSSSTNKLDAFNQKAAPGKSNDFDPFSNLRGQAKQGQTSSSTATKPPLFDAFGASPFAENAGTSHLSSSSANVSQATMFSAFDNMPALSSNSSSSLSSSTNLKASEASLTPSMGADFSVFGSLSSSQPTAATKGTSDLDSMFGSQPKSLLQQTSGIDNAIFPPTSATSSASQFENSFEPTQVAPQLEAFGSVFSTSQPSPAPSKPAASFNDMFSPAAVPKATQQSAFEDAFAPKASSNQDFGFNASFEPKVSSSSSSTAFAPIPSSFDAFDSNFAPVSEPQKSSLSKTSTVQDSFGQMPFDTLTSTADPFGAANSSAFGGISSSKPAFSELAPPTSSMKPLSVDLFDSAPFDSGADKEKSAEAQPSFDLFSSKNESSGSVGVVDKYSVFSALNPDFSSAEPTSESSKSDFPPFQSETVYSQPQSAAQPEVPLQSFQGSSMFDDSFDPFNEKKTIPTNQESTAFASQPQAGVMTADFDQFDVFSQLSSSKTPEVPPPPSSTGSIARQRPSAKAPAAMVVLPPPAKVTERKRPSKPTPPTATLPSSANNPAPSSASDSAAVFDPFVNSSGIISVETDGAAFAKPARPVAPAQKPTAQKPSQVAGKPAPRRAKRRAPPPPTQQPGRSAQSTFYTGEKKEAAISLLDLDFTSSPTSAASTSGAPPPQPLLILPTADIMSKGAPPSRPPPPKSGDDTATSRPKFGDLPPPLPPRPGPGHVLFHHILKTGPYCQALFEFEAESHDELSFKAGEGIKLDSDISEEWFAGSIGSRRGIFPKNCVEVKIPLPSRPSTPAAALSPITTPSPAPSPAPSPIPDSIDWGSAAAPRQEVAPQKDIFNAWGDSRTPSPPPTVAAESDPIRTPTPEPEVIPEQPKLPEPEPEPVSIDTCTAIYSFEAQESDELTISEGDTIDVLEFVDDDWIRGKIGDKVGIFPRSYATFGEDDEEQLEEILNEETHQVNVFYDFEAGADDELSLSAGDMVTVISTVGDEWIKGRFGGKEGIFPACFVPAIPDHWNIPEDSETFTENFETTEESSSSSSSSSSDDDKDHLSEISETRSCSAEPSSDLGEVQIIADFDAENDFELSVKTGDIVKITARLNEMWLEGECDGNTGILPVNFVKWLENSPETDIIGNPAATDLALGGLERQDTIKSGEETPRIDQTAAPLSSTFSEGNPFAQEFGMAALPPQQDTGDMPPPPTQEDLDKTLVSADNPFTTDVLGEVAVDTPPPSTPTLEPSIKAGDKRIALYEFTSENDDELDFKQGDLIEVTEYLNEDWLRGKCGGKEGLFPTSFTEGIPQS